MLIETYLLPKISHHWCKKLLGVFVKLLPKELKGQLPSSDEIAKLLEDVQ